MIVRVITKDGEEILQEEFSEFPVTIGRSKSSGIPLALPGISAQHAELSMDGKKLLIRDLGSRNGTYVGQERIILKAVDLPCTIRLGAKTFVEITGGGIETEEEIPEPVMLKMEAASLAPGPLPKAVKEKNSRKPAARGVRIAFPGRPGELLFFCLLAVMVLLHAVLLFETGPGDFSFSFLKSLGKLVAIWGGGCLLSVVFALPEYLLRKELRWRAFLPPFLFAGLLLFFHLEYLLPLGLAGEGWGAAKTWSLIFSLAGPFWVFSVLTDGLIPWKWSRWRFAPALLLALLTGLTAFRFGVPHERNAVMRALFRASESPGRMIAGTPVSTHEFSRELREIEQQMITKEKSRP